MSIAAKIVRKKEHAERRREALSAAAAIVQMDPNVREDLITYIKAFNKAQAAGDEEEQEYLVNAILEVFETDTNEDDIDLAAWEDEAKSTPQGREAAKELQAHADAFFDAYQHPKARCGLMSIRAVAEAAGLSPTTVHAIEKQRVKPQFKTLQALAKAFGVSVKVLNGK